MSSRSWGNGERPGKTGVDNQALIDRVAGDNPSEIITVATKHQPPTAWSAKAEELLRNQDSAVGAAARASLPVAVSVLKQASSRGVDLGELLPRTRSRAANAEAFAAAYRPYVRPTDGLDGVRVAPFQLLASEGRPTTYASTPPTSTLPTGWSPPTELIITTRRVWADTEDGGQAR